MNSMDNTKSTSTNGSTAISEAEKLRTEALADGSQNDNTSDTATDTASGGPAD